MKDYKEMAESVINRGNALIEARKIKMRRIRHISFMVSGACAAAIVGLGLWNDPQLKNAIDRHQSASNESIMPDVPVDNTNEYNTVTSSLNDNGVTEAANQVTTTSANTSDILPEIPEDGTVSTTVVFVTPAETTANTAIDPATWQTTASPCETQPVQTTSPAVPEEPREVTDISNTLKRFTDIDTGIRYTSVGQALNTDTVEELIASEKIPFETDSIGSVVEINAELYKVSDISEEAMIWVRYEGQEGFTLYRNQDFKTETFGGFIESLGLCKQVVFNSAEYYDLTDGYRLLYYHGFEEDMISDELLRFSDAPAVDYSSLFPDQIVPKLNIICDMPFLRSGIGVSEKGYITTNLTGGGSAFYIGESNAAELISLITQNYPYTILNGESGDIIGPAETE